VLIHRNTAAVTVPKIMKSPRSLRPKGFHRSRASPKKKDRYTGTAVSSRKLATCSGVALTWFFSMKEVAISSRKPLGITRNTSSVSGVKYRNTAPARAGSLEVDTVTRATLTRHAPAGARLSQVIVGMLTRPSGTACGAHEAPVRTAENHSGTYRQPRLWHAGRSSVYEKRRASRIQAGAGGGSLR